MTSIPVAACRISCKIFQTPLFKKQTISDDFFITFLKFSSNLQHWEKKDESPCKSISEIIDSERGGT